MLLCCVVSLQATEKNLFELQNSLEQLQKIIPVAKVISTPIVTPCETSGNFDEDFRNIAAAFEAIQCHKDKDFTFSVTKETDTLPQWKITLTGSHTPLDAEDEDVFDKIIRGAEGNEGLARMVSADGDYIVIFSSGFLDNPPAKHQNKDQSTVLVIPQHHFTDIIKLGTVSNLQKFLRKCAAIAQLGDKNHYKFHTNRGYGSGQRVPHLHMHVTMYHAKTLPEPLFKQIDRKKWNRAPFELDLSKLNTTGYVIKKKK